MPSDEESEFIPKVNKEREKKGRMANKRAAAPSQIKKEENKENVDGKKKKTKPTKFRPQTVQLREIKR